MHQELRDVGLLLQHLLARQRIDPNLQLCVADIGLQHRQVMVFKTSGGSLMNFEALTRAAAGSFAWKATASAIASWKAFTASGCAFAQSRVEA